MEVALRYTLLLTPFTLFTLFTLFINSNCNTLLKQKHVMSKMLN